ncbi:hypothetical protein TrRE_jg6581 [Triparma retinervis]|uniref:Uncharacterized protein n=1 Tax=Triparma retinervis TaxID=2557542 RepID=A0A9W7FU84_9STRA|nr:hypothetical protein TrRE_jg6581 [Triparma retinervis]
MLPNSPTSPHLQTRHLVVQEEGGKGDVVKPASREFGSLPLLFMELLFLPYPCFSSVPVDPNIPHFLSNTFFSLFTPLLSLLLFVGDPFLLLILLVKLSKIQNSPPPSPPSRRVTPDPPCPLGTTLWDAAARAPSWFSQPSLFIFPSTSSASPSAVTVLPFKSRNFIRLWCLFSPLTPPPPRLKRASLKCPTTTIGATPI